MATTVLPVTTITAGSGGVPDPMTPGGSAAWRTYKINGVVCPGVIAIDGIHGFERETGWDKKKGKGAGGATLTMTTWPPAEGSITSWFYGKGQIPAWEDFTAILEYHSDKVANTPSASIEHPALQINDITAVVVHKVGIVRHLGRQLYSVTVDYIEWLPPPPATIVSTPIKPSNDQPDLPGDVPQDQADADANLMEAQAAYAATWVPQSALGMEAPQ